MTDNDTLLSDAQQILAGLKRTSEGTFLYDLIARGLRKFGSTRIEGAFLIFADKLLERYLANPDSDPGTRVRVKVIQQRLRPYLEDLANRPLPEPKSTGAAETATDAAAGPPVTAPADGPSVPATEAGSAVPTPPVSTPETAHAIDDAASSNGPIPEAAPPAGSSLPEQLARQMAAALTRGREFDDLLRSSLDTLERNSAAADIGELKELLRRGIEELIDEHQSLERNLTGARRGLQTMVEDHRQLEQALDKARKHSLTDELTGLPNHAAFLRQLNAEIGRARRYGFSLALALIDIDDLKDVNARFGQAAVDTVLQAYAHEIMTRFRSYDMVARYGDDQFAVLMPNTQREGAAHAVEKAQKQAADTYIQYDGHNMPLPSFSSVLTVYAHGEPPAALLKRADEALSHAKQRGRGQAVVALPTR
jgi:diguanylate cyclase (GGDEF)-like protein